MDFVSNWTALRLHFVFLLCKNPFSSLVIFRHKKTQPFRIAFFKVAGWTRLELATSCVTGSVILRNYQFIRKLCWKIVGY